MGGGTGEASYGWSLAGCCRWCCTRPPHVQTSRAARCSPRLLAAACWCAPTHPHSAFPPHIITACPAACNPLCIVCCVAVCCCCYCRDLLTLVLNLAGAWLAMCLPLPLVLMVLHVWRSMALHPFAFVAVSILFAVTYPAPVFNCKNQKLAFLLKIVFTVTLTFCLGF